MRRLVALLVLAGACSSPAGGPGVPRPVEPAALYAQNCARCHGPDGKGIAALRESLPALRDLTAPDVKARSSAELERVIMTGRNQMPSFGGQLSPPKIQAVVGYVRELGAKATP